MLKILVSVLIYSSVHSVFMHPANEETYILLLKLYTIKKFWRTKGKFTTEENKFYYDGGQVRK